MTFFGVANENHFCMISGIFWHMICKRVVAIFYYYGCVAQWYSNGLQNRDFTGGSNPSAPAKNYQKGST